MRRIVVVETVDSDVVRSRALTGERKARGARRPLLRRPIGRHTRRKQREADETTPVDRKVLDLLLRDDARDDRTAAVDDRRVSRHEHDLLAAGDVQRQADVDQAAERQARRPRAFAERIPAARRARCTCRAEAPESENVRARRSSRCEPGWCRRSAPSLSHPEGPQTIDRRSSPPNRPSSRASALPRQLKNLDNMPPAQDVIHRDME